MDSSEYVNERTIRTVGPAVVLVLELEAPLRFETMHSTDAEFDSLKSWLHSNDIAFHVSSAFFEAEEAQRDAPSRAHEHFARLDAATLIRERVLD